MRGVHRPGLMMAADGGMYNRLQGGDLAKQTIEYVCQQCGRRAPKPLGRCPQCGAWNSMVAESISRTAAPAREMGSVPPPVRLLDLEGQAEERLALPMNEFARVLGGGIVPGSIVLIGGDPGIGKSTLLLQAAMKLAGSMPVLYVSGEESARQIKSRARRLGAEQGDSDGLYVMAETELEAVLGHVERLSPRVLVVDSIQTMSLAAIASSPGSISQVRECAAQLQSFAKRSGVAVFLIGHVTKEGAIAGPRVMEHIVDTVLYLEGDAFHAYRLLRAVKNRFGATSEVGVFRMTAAGMEEVENPSEAFLAERVAQAPGSAVAVTMEGTRPLLVEVQALTTPTAFGNPRRTANGVDFNRLLLTIAVLGRRAGIKLGDQDVFVNVVGGLRVDEPAADLAMAAALASSAKDRPIPTGVALVGELGLSGELRSVPRLAPRVREAAKLGFERLIVPKHAASEELPTNGIALQKARSLREALHDLFD